MKLLKPAFSLLLLSLYSICFSQVNMFRGTPSHQYVTYSKKNYVFAEEAWRFNAEAPIRSTVVYNANSIFFGASNGKFFSLDKNSGKLKWMIYTGDAINSSPAFHNGSVYFSDNKQTLYALDANTGKQKWKFDFGTNRIYEWKFDYFYSSPTITGNQIVIGAKDGFVYNLNESNGKINWKFKTSGIVRSTPSVSDGVVYFGDTDGIVYAVHLINGKEIWRYLIVGNSLKNEDFGFDRRAVISSPVVKDDRVIVGGRDGFLYAINKLNGKEIWRVDHQVSWIISSVAIRDSIIVTGTSDGRFVQAINFNTGKEIWKFRTISIVWSSPAIHNNLVYIGSGEGVLYCLDLFTGNLVNRFQAKGNIFSSPVISDTLLFFGADNGNLYALKNSSYSFADSKNLKRYVFWQPDINIYFRAGVDIRIRSYLSSNGYTVINSSTLDSLLKQFASAPNSVIVFASNFFPQSILADYENSLLRKFLNNGGRIVVLGNNPIMFKTDPVSHMVTGRNFLLSDSVLNIKYGPDDLRSFTGIHPAFPTEEGKKWGLRSFWVAPLSLPADQVDYILGKDENGLASSWVKKYNSIRGSGFIQIWVDADGVEDLSFIIRVAEYQEQ